MKWYTYRQNNSGGGFDFDADAGISVTVLIQAESASAADDKAESIGIYFDGTYYGRDCDCCGDRWYRTASYFGDEEGTDEPEMYGQDATPGALFTADRWIKWMGEKPEGFLHYADGRVLPFGL